MPFAANEHIVEFEKMPELLEARALMGAKTADLMSLTSAWCPVSRRRFLYDPNPRCVRDVQRRAAAVIAG
jgi:hypothetical protein